MGVGLLAPTPFLFEEKIMNKIRFIADTNRKKIVLGMGITLCHGENAWSEGAVREFLNQEIMNKFNIRFIDSPPSDITLESKPETNPIQEPVLELESIPENKIIKKILEVQKNVDDNILLSPMRFTKLTKEKAKELVEKIDNVAILKKLYDELGGFMGSRTYKRIVNDRIAKLQNTGE